MTIDEIEQKKRQAVEFFESGYNCSQAVLMAYAQNYDVELVTASKIATSFGGGMGRLREVCGAVSGMFMVLGLEYSFTDTKDKDAKNQNYKAVQDCANEFKSVMGSYICADLLNLNHVPQPPISSERNEVYYKTRPCTRCVALAAEIVGRKIANEK